MLFDWQGKYDEEAARLVQVLRRWYELENEVKRLAWRLYRCRHPEDASPPGAGEVEKPMLLRRAEAGKPLVPDEKRGRKRGWKDRTQEVSSSREHYEADNKRLEARVQRLTMQLADCTAAQEKKQHRPAPDVHEPMIGRAAQALRIEQAWADEHAPEAPAAEPSAPDRARRRLEEAHRALREEKKALERRVATLSRQIDALTGQLDVQAKELDAWRESVERLKDERARDRQRFAALETLSELAQRFLQGQRSFLFLHNDPQLENALAGLVDYSLARLAVALARADTVGALAMCTNLDAVATNLQTYNGKRVHGLEQALEILPALKIDTDAKPALPPAPERHGPEAKPFLVRLKYLRDVARLDLRPFYYLDDKNQVQRIG